MSESNAPLPTRWCSSGHGSTRPWRQEFASPSTWMTWQPPVSPICPRRWTVSLRGFDERGFALDTNYRSPKARDPRRRTRGPWTCSTGARLERQVRATGTVAWWPARGVVAGVLAQPSAREPPLAPCTSTQSHVVSHCRAELDACVRGGRLPVRRRSAVARVLGWLRRHPGRDRVLGRVGRTGCTDRIRYRRVHDEWVRERLVLLARPLRLRVFEPGTCSAQLAEAATAGPAALDGLPASSEASRCHVIVTGAVYRPIGASNAPSAGRHPLACLSPGRGVDVYEVHRRQVVAGIDDAGLAPRWSAVWDRCTRRQWRGCRRGVHTKWCGGGDRWCGRRRRRAELLPTTSPGRRRPLPRQRTTACHGRTLWKLAKTAPRNSAGITIHGRRGRAGGACGVDPARATGWGGAGGGGSTKLSTSSNRGSVVPGGGPGVAFAGVAVSAGSAISMGSVGSPASGAAVGGGVGSPVGGGVHSPGAVAATAGGDWPSTAAVHSGWGRAPTTSRGSTRRGPRAAPVPPEPRHELDGVRLDSCHSRTGLGTHDAVATCRSHLSGRPSSSPAINFFRCGQPRGARRATSRALSCRLIFSSRSRA